MILDKEELKSTCADLLEEKISRCRDMLSSIDASAHDDTKSSAGDKFETSREMLKQEAEKINGQLDVLLYQKQVLSMLDTSLSSNVIAHGSLVQTDKGSFYISVSLGKINYTNDLSYAISDESPMALALIGKSVGDKVIVNTREIRITEVC